ncbi:hypothetical protein A2108_01230 [Candidatus Wolfebacteria bacterium GWA1_42_9]|uniref:Uncharacterized protein n=1 Tax=Candidatus Wolfebacteria bacterium GWA1_42_9 TaxID=1802553 RepID=A0A1F8DMD2_9BACT|nr:MAG: hypothetical protein UW08_C0003G0048 [Parcubacteria group bacterium GW2011_GWB1_43_8b]OGM89596.1 MAG: hypothetical protein A2108_01230 [Candidatus Wolfebacteria bacterium GWA1_42_9]
MLPSQISQEAKSSIYQGRFSYWKASILSVLVVIAAFFTGYFADKSFFDFSGLNLKSSLVLLACSVIFLALFLLVTLFIEKKGLLAAIVVLSALAFFVVFLPAFNLIVALSGLVTIILFLSAVLAGRAELESSIKIRFFGIGRTVLSKVILSLALVAAVFFYSAFSDRDLDENNPLISRGLFEGTLSASSKILKPLMGDLDFSLSLREISTRLVADQIKNQPSLIGPVVSLAQKELTERSIAGFQQQFKSIFGISINPDAKLSVALYDGFLSKINGLKKESRNLLIGVFAFLLFLTVQALSPFIRLIATALAFILYELLMVFGFGALVFESQSKEKIVLP